MTKGINAVVLQDSALEIYISFKYCMYAMFCYCGDHINHRYGGSSHC